MWLSSSWEAMWGLTSLNPPPPPNSPDWVINRSPAGKRGASRRWDTEEALIWVDSGLTNETLKISEQIRWELESCTQKLLPTDHVFLGGCYTFFFTIVSFTSKVWDWDLQTQIFPRVSLSHLHWIDARMTLTSCPLVILQLQWSRSPVISPVSHYSNSLRAFLLKRCQILSLWGSCVFWKTTPFTSTHGAERAGHCESRRLHREES